MISLTQLTHLNIKPSSVVAVNGMEFGLAQLADGKRLAMLGEAGAEAFALFDGQIGEWQGKTLLLGPVNTLNAAALRQQLTWLQPTLLGLKTSAGMGDRLGVATPGHVRAVRAVGGGVAPIFTQQSIREMTRTGRTPQQVMDDATWGLFAEGWQDAFGADADHLKTPEDMDACLKVGFTFFTVDPGAFVDNRAEKAGASLLSELAAALPRENQPAASGLAGKTVHLDGLQLHFDEMTLLKAAVKYGRAVAHVAMMYHHLRASACARPFELEVSVDETDQPTSHAEHYYIAHELKRLGVQWVSLAPRYVGRFEKGVDYIGDLAAFEADFTGHAVIAREMGPYKLSLHSGSDKFSIYPIASRVARGSVHLKTAGTSYLEALRTIGQVSPGFLKEIYLFARERYDEDKLSYHVSAELGRAPLAEDVQDWPGLLEQFDAREIFHVTFGSVLTGRLSDGRLRFYERFMQTLLQHENAYAANLERHFIRHLTPLVNWRQ